MLSYLHIENVAVIKEAELSLAGGFNVLTGETGAGKSVLVDSINLALGERVSRDVVRSGENAARVSAMFTGISPSVAAYVRGLGFDCEDGELLLEREITADGRSSCRISGRSCTVSMLRGAGRLLVNIHGQHENQTLFSPEGHFRYLDSYADDEMEMAAYRTAYENTSSIYSELSRLCSDESEKRRRCDMLRYEIDELEAAGLSSGEEEKLLSQRKRLANAEKITACANEAYAALDGSEEADGALSCVSAAADDISSIVEYLPEAAGLAQRLSSLSYELEDCRDELRGYVDDEGPEPGELDKIEERLDVIFRIKNKYGGSEESAVKYLEEAKKQLSEIENSDDMKRKLEKDLNAAEEKLKAAGASLSSKRRRAAKELSKSICRELSFLDMPGVKFITSIRPLERPLRDGCEKIEFLISANPGSPPKPISKIASGGEISRIMLAIKTVLAGNDEIGTLIFDEIDTGVSGSAAQKIGLKLKEVSKSRQVICVTHLSQIASQADRHILIEKTVRNGKTYTRLKILDYVGRKRELARIIGSAETKATLGAAEEMLDAAGVAKDKNRSA